MHTRAPWIVVEKKTNDPCYPHAVEGDGFELARTVSRADALLIAAAPELLAALRALLDSNDGFGRRLQRDVDRAEAAIASASI